MKNKKEEEITYVNVAKSVIVADVKNRKQELMKQK